jgi:exosortase H (IPTLxxWG-CTERM-specific)
MKRGLEAIIRHRPSRGLWLRLGLCAGAITLMLWAANADSVTTSIQTGFARVVAGILNLFGEGASVAGNVVQTERFGVSVVTACTGLFLIGLFAAAVILFPARPSAKLIGLGLGVGGISALNVVRLVSLYYVGVHLPTALDTVHLVIWQSLLIVFAVALWLAWAATWGRAPNRGRARP